MLAMPALHGFILKFAKEIRRLSCTGNQASILPAGVQNITVDDLAAISTLSR